MEKNSITKLFEDVNMYEKKVFDLYTRINDVYSTIEDDNIIKIYEYLGLLKEEKLITKCIFCEKEFPFKKKLLTFSYSGGGKYDLALGKDANNYYDLDFTGKPISYNKIKFFNESIVDYVMYLDYYFECTNDNMHQYTMRFLITKYENKLSIIKVGQFPELVSLGEYNSKKYEKILKKIDDSYLDYYNAEKSFKYGLYSGAYLYLRRVFEKMINYYLKQKGISLADKTPAKDKIAEIRDCFDPSIKDVMYPLYDVLSKGIHKMTDNECQEAYLELESVFVIQMLYEKAKMDKNSLLESSRKTIAKVQQKYAK